MRIAVVGAGGTGGYYGGLLAQKKHEVTFIARGAHLHAIQKNGLQVKSVFGEFHIKPASATDNPNDVGPQDLVLFCTKTYDTETAAEGAKPLVGAETTILSLQNGIDAADRIGNILGKEHMLAGVTGISSAIESPGVIKQVSNFRWVQVGELDGRMSKRVQVIGDAFKETGISTEVSEHIVADLWAKLVFIAAAGGFGSLTRLPMGSYRSVPETRILIRELMQETTAVAAAHGVKLPADIIEKSLAAIDNAGPHIKASMQLDVESGHRSELESIIGVIGRKGRQFAVPTPVADMIYAILLPGELVIRST